jgi:hypothetical protein
MSDNISNLTPNANMAQGCFDSPIQLNSINITDIRVDQPFNNTIQSMIDTGMNAVEELKADVEVIGKDITLKV